MFNFLKNLFAKKQPEKKLVLTEVFPPDIKPVRSGVYLTSTVIDQSAIKCYRSYDVISDRWSIGHSTVYSAQVNKPYYFKGDIFYWQGVLNAQ